MSGRNAPLVGVALTQCHLDEPAGDGRTCPPCRGRGTLLGVVRFDGSQSGTLYEPTCPWCDGDGYSGRVQAILADLQRELA